MGLINYALAVTLNGGIQGGRTLGVLGCSLGIVGRQITRVYPGTPAEQGGLQTKDKIVKFWDLQQSKDLDGAPYTSVCILVKRGDQYILCICRRLPYQELPQGSNKNTFKGKEKYEVE